MFAVIRHTFEMINPEPDNPKSYKIHSDWKHYVWLFDTEEDAMTFAVTLLDHPLLIANEHSLAYAIESLKTGKFFQVGRESVAVAKVLERLEVIADDEEITGEDDDEKSIH